MIKIDNRLNTEINNQTYRIGFLSDKTTPVYYWNVNGQWLMLNEGSLVRRIKATGLRDSVTDSTMSQAEQNRRLQAAIDRLIINIQDNNRVAAALRLAGRKEGVYANGSFGKVGSNHPLILNLQDSTFNEGEAGECPFIMNMLNNCFGHEPDQVHTFLGWLKTGRDAIRANKPVPNAYLIMVGNVKSGKTAIQDLIITPSFNDSVSDPWGVVAKDGKFNKELCSACHWKSEDAVLNKRIANREFITGQMKRIASTTQETYEPKGVDSLTISINRFASLSANDDDKSLHSLPIIDDRSNADKIHLLKIADELDVGYKIDGTNYDRLPYEIGKEINHFLHLVDNYQAPIRLRDNRYIVKAYHSPYIVNRITESEPFMMLLAMLQDEMVYNTLFIPRSRQIDEKELNPEYNENSTGYMGYKEHKYKTKTTHHYKVVSNTIATKSAEDIRLILRDMLGEKYAEFQNNFTQGWSLGSALRKLADHLDKSEKTKGLLIGGKDLHSRYGNKWQISYKISDEPDRYITEEEYQVLEEKYYDIIKEEVL